ncbi:MAG: 6-pyruvoyl trahydropterin synthase family protein, partial [Gammaproteobacteria bacterium]
KLHGHNFFIHASITTETNDNGIAFDYAIYKQKLRNICRSLNGHFLLAANSPYQTIEYTDDFVIVHFANEKLPFPKNDVLFLPLKNITVEELSLWFIDQLTEDKTEIETYNIHRFLVKVYSAPGQCGVAEWINPDKAI